MQASFRVENSFWEQCQVSLERDYPFLRRDQNAVLSALRGGAATVEGVKRAVRQYACFPFRIVSILRAAESRLVDWSEVAEELKRNCSEELGSRTSGIPHVSILCTAMAREAGLDLAGSRADEHTEKFFAAITPSKEHGIYFAGGIMYAVEASAIPELEIVAEIVNELCARTGRSRPINVDSLRVSSPDNPDLGDRPENYSLQHFFGLHVSSFEIGHRDGLSSTISTHLTSSAHLAEFQNGFNIVMKAMESWWSHLAELASADQNRAM